MKVSPWFTSIFLLIINSRLIKFSDALQGQHSLSKASFETNKIKPFVQFRRPTTKIKNNNPIVINESNNVANITSRRRHITALLTSALLSLSQQPEITKADVSDILSSAVKNSEITYSTNAKNFNRLSSGDVSGGSTYNNNPSNPAAAKRRAMAGCKDKSVREEAGIDNEKECNRHVMNGDVELMLKTLQKLDCPSCPYGIGRS